MSYRIPPRKTTPPTPAANLSERARARRNAAIEEESRRQQAERTAAAAAKSARLDALDAQHQANVAMITQAAAHDRGMSELETRKLVNTLESRRQRFALANPDRRLAFPAHADLRDALAKRGYGIPLPRPVGSSQLPPAKSGNPSMPGSAPLPPGASAESVANVERYRREVQQEQENRQKYADRLRQLGLENPAHGTSRNGSFG